MRLTLLLLMAVLAPMVRSQDRCRVAQDLVVQARERLKGDPTPSNVADGIQLLKQANLGCPTSGDGWYYRSLFEDKLGHKSAAEFALKQARINGSEAMDNGADPFRIASPTNQPAVGPVRQKWALIVGIKSFPRCKGVDSLDYAEQDAKGLAAVLQDPKVGRFPDGNVTLLTDDSKMKPTLANIKAAMNKIARNAESSDLVLIFIASHGTSRRNDSIGQLNYILTSDSENMADNPEESEDKLWGTALPMVEISDDVRSRIRAQRTIILLDTCHSEGGTTRLRAAPSKENFQSLKTGAGRVIISSSRQTERSWESEKLEHGVFTGELIEALKQQEGKAPISKVFEYLERQVPKQVADEHHEEQHPVMVRSEQGADIVIGSEPTAQAAVISLPGIRSLSLLSSLFR